MAIDVGTYVNGGYSVIPLKPGTKNPMAGFGPYHVIRGWASYWMGPTPAGVAIATGGGLAVLDIEPEHIEAMRELIDNIDTPQVVTARGGRHLYCGTGGRIICCPKLVVNGKKVGDVKCNGGFAVAPPTATPHGSYEWMQGRAFGEVPLAPLPAWSLDCIEAAIEKKARAGQVCFQITAGAQAQIRKHTLQEVLARVDSPILRTIDNGYKLTAGVSRSEIDYGAIIGLIVAGATYDQVLDVFCSSPIGEKMHEDGRGYLQRSYAKALTEVRADDAAAIEVKCVRSITSPGDPARNGAKMRTTLYLQPVGKPGASPLRVSMASVLGPPRDGQLAGEWLRTAEAFGVDVNKGVTGGIARLVVKNGTIRRFLPGTT